MTMYRKIDALQTPYDAQTIDEHGRAVFIVNFMAEKAPSVTFARELAVRLIAAGIGTAGTTFVVGSHAMLPPTGTVVSLIETSGTVGIRTQNVPGVAYHRPTAMIRVHAEKSEDAMAKAWAVYNSLTVVKNQDLPAA